MSISQISPVVTAPEPAKISPLVKSDNYAGNVEASQLASKSVQAAKTDTVTFSKEALQKLSDGASGTAKSANGKQQQSPKSISVKA